MSDGELIHGKEGSSTSQELLIQRIREAKKEFMSVLNIDWDKWTIEGAKKFAEMDKDCKLIFLVKKWFGDK